MNSYQKLKMLEYKNYICGDCKYIELNDIEATDIDTEDDFKICNSMYEEVYDRHR